MIVIVLYFLGNSTMLLQLELLFQSTSHSEKDKLVSVSYDPNACLTNYKIYV